MLQHKSMFNYSFLYQIFLFVRTENLYQLFLKMFNGSLKKQNIQLF